MRAILGLTALVAACTPSGARFEANDSAAPIAAVEAPVVEEDPGCGPIGIVESGPWRTDHPLLAPLRAGWHPRAESGRPIAVRDAIPPWSVPGYEFVQVQLEGVPRAVQSCFVPPAADEPIDRENPTYDHRECGVLWKMVDEANVQTLPRTAGDWARLVATFDGASAVFASPDELAACSVVPPPVRDWTPGLRGSEKAPELVFVERIDAERSSTWLRVQLEDRRGTLHISRSEIATAMRDVPAPPLAGVEPWDGVWERSDDPIRARIGLRMPRVHPLWRTPVADACPAVMFSELTPELDRGDTYTRVNERLARTVDWRLRESSLSDVMLLHDHLALPGVRLVAAMDTESSCTMGWSHAHCLVADDAVWCPDGKAADLQAIVDRFALTPATLSDAQSFELAMIMSGVPTFVLEPALLSECTRVAEARAHAPRVVRDLGGVTVEFTAIDDEGHGYEHRIAIADGRVRMTSQRTWTAPSQEDVWGAL